MKENGERKRSRMFLFCAKAFSVIAGVFSFLLVFFLCCFVIDSFFHYITPAEKYKLAEEKAPVKYDQKAGFVINDDGTYKRSFVFRDGSPSLDSTFTLQNGMRHTPVSGEKRDKFALFFGDSFTFGVGVNDTETLPYYFGEEQPGYTPYNFGIPGGSVQHMYLKLQGKEIEAKVKEQDGIAFYWFFGFHTRRTVGGMPAFNRWADMMPCFELEEDQLVYKGNFRKAHPRRALLYDLLYKSSTVRYLNLFLPRTFSEYDYQVTVRLLLESYRLFKESCPNGKFILLMWDNRDSYTPVQKMISEAGIPVILIKEFFSGVDNPLETGQTVPDGHLTGPGYQRIAKGLAAHSLLSASAAYEKK